MKAITITAKTMDLIKTLFWEGMADAKLTKRQKTKLLTEFLEDKSRLRALVIECLRRHFAARVVTRSPTARPIKRGSWGPWGQRCARGVLGEN
jgi:hypothetical protein